MSIASRITSIEGHIEEDYNALERLGADLTNVDKNIENIASVVNDIYDKLPKVTGTGSDLSLTPTLKGGMDILPLGNAEQDTIAYIDVGTWEVGNINGTTGQEVASTDAIRTDFISVKSNVLYNLLRTITTGFMYFRFYNSNKQYLGTQLTEGMITTNQPDNRMLTGVSSMTMTINNTNVAYMRMVDSSNNLSTQYTISTQAPTPDNPIDVKVVTGDNQVVVRNTFNFTLEQGTIGGADGQPSSSSTRVRTNDYVDIGSATQIYISCQNANLYNSKIFSYDENNTYLGNLDPLNSIPKTVTLPNGTKKIKVIFGLISNINLTPSEVENPILSTQNQSTTLHLGSLELCKIGDYQDVITGSIDNWKVVRNVGHIASYNGETITTDYISTTGELTTGAEVYYQLEESTETPITDTTLITDLNNLQDLLSYDGTTNITITSDSSNAQMLSQVSALKGE